MARSYAPSDDGYSRYSASSPMYYQEDDGPVDPSLRPMKLKVLYTCDDKANCMAKWHQVVHIRTAHLDEKTEVGVVELKTCIKAIVTCSPELVAKLGQDYTVYAYDYSEYEVPLVGQGMLSWVLASASPTPAAPAEQSSTMVTGRVTKPAKALFARDSITETLEVKLRLVPVPTILQSEYIESMKRYRDISQVMPGDFDAQSWSQFLKDNPQILSMVDSERNGSPENRHAIGNVMGIEHVQRLMQRNQSFNQRPQSMMDRRDSFVGSAFSRDGSRTGSPTPTIQSNIPGSFIDHLGRPDSRASYQSVEAGISKEALDDADTVSNDGGHEDGPARKRARMTQVKRPRKGEAFGGQVDSLRALASGAASVRVLQPTAIRPGPVPHGALDEPPRAPTPVPQNAAFGPRRELRPRRSGLGQTMSSFPSSDPATSFHDSARPSDTTITSPEAAAAMLSSPGEDPGSSPPVPVSRGVSAAPSSPQLPRLPPPHEDSGFMSGAMDEDELDNGPPKPSVEVEPQARDTISQPAEKTKTTAKGRKTAVKRPRADSSTAQMTAQEKSRKAARHAAGWRRIQSWTEGQSSDTVMASSDMAPPGLSKQQQAEAEARSKYDKEHQKHLIQGRLTSAIEAGEMPPFCENCGDINTPTWRKAFARTFSGSPANVVLSKEQGGVVAVQVLEQDETGNVKVFKIIKKSLLETDEDFESMLLCNPCGLWLVNRKQMRPPEKWNSNANKKKEPRSGSGRSRQKSAGRGRSLTAAPSEMTEPPSEMSLQPFESQIDPNLSSRYGGLPPTDAPEQEEPELPVLPEEPPRPVSKGNMKPRSDGNVPAGAVAALQRAIQSSPGHVRGSKQSPIEVETTPDRTRRMLFPSPKTAGPLGTSSGNRQRHSLQNSPDAPRQFDMVKNAGVSPEIFVKNSGKENEDPASGRRATGARPTTPSPGAEIDELHDLFNDPKTPLTPSRNDVTLPFPKSPSALFKTPGKQTPQKGLGSGDFFSSAAKAFLHPPRTPSRTPSKKALEALGAETPFTRHINQLLSEPVDVFDMNTSPSAFFADFGANFNDLAMSTDMPMPSSPPIGALPSKSRLNEDWSELGLNSSPFKASPLDTSIVQDNANNDTQENGQDRPVS